MNAAAWVGIPSLVVAAAGYYIRRTENRHDAA
jgi:hypothetical protein